MSKYSIPSEYERYSNIVDNLVAEYTKLVEENLAVFDGDDIMPLFAMLGKTLNQLREVIDDINSAADISIFMVGARINIIFFNEDRTEVRRLLPANGYISDVSIGSEISSYYGSNNTFYDFNLYSIALSDDNGDGRINENDNMPYYISNLDGTDLRQITPDSLKLDSYWISDNENEIYFDRLIEDTSKPLIGNGRRNYFEKTRIVYYYNRKTNEFKLFDELQSEFDSIQESFKKETFLFFEYVLKNNRSVFDFLSSDYTILDRRLAKLYKLPVPEITQPLTKNDYNGNAPSTGFVKYNFKDNRRGGLMGHASVLTVSANGVDTSPVVRGVWILEKLLCSPPPPAPANVAAIEPDTRGAKTIKERLAKHQNDPNCSSCHKRIDPIGFALENYNPVGQWRDRYRRKKVDASGELHGEKFKNIIGLKEALLNEKDDFAEAFSEKILTYAIGRKPTFLDEDQLKTLKSDFRANNYQLKELIRLICTSPLFIQK